VVGRGRAGAVSRGCPAGETVDRYVAESYARLARTARITTHLPALPEGFAAERLAALAQHSGVLVSDVPQVLFVCVHNAGSAPVESINAAVTQLMEEIGLDLTHEDPKPLTDDVVHASDVVITMGCGDACPVYPGKRYVDWEAELKRPKPPRGHVNFPDLER